MRRLFSHGESLVGISNNTNYYYTIDHLSSVREAIDANGLLATRYAYDPYGQKSVLKENVQTTVSYNGDYVHQKSGMYLTWFRPLDSASGRWLSRDPTAERAGPNLYAFVNNNPINYKDSIGLCTDNEKGWHESAWNVAEIFDTSAWIFVSYNDFATVAQQYQLADVLAGEEGVTATTQLNLALLATETATGVALNAIPSVAIGAFGGWLIMNSQDWLNTATAAERLDDLTWAIQQKQGKFYGWGK
jgi:RHS repeat-associated protein